MEATYSSFPLAGVLHLGSALLWRTIIASLPGDWWLVSSAFPFVDGLLCLLDRGFGLMLDTVEIDCWGHSCGLMSG